jgi:uncharacterized protein
MLTAREPGVAAALLLLSYPLHAPSGGSRIAGTRPGRGIAASRTGHFPELRTPALFVHGSEDPFGSPAEVESAIAAIPAPVKLIVIDDAGHDLVRRRSIVTLADVIAEAFGRFVDSVQTGSSSAASRSSRQ